MLCLLLQVEARFGEQANRMAVALRKCIALEDSEVVGCVATLATVRHEDLNRLLSTLYGSSMQLLITENRVASARVAQHLQSGRVRQQHL